MQSLAELARAAGAMQLGEEGPDGAHWIFSASQLDAFAATIVTLARARERGELPPCLPPLPY